MHLLTGDERRRRALPLLPLLLLLVVVVVVVVVTGIRDLCGGSGVGGKARVNETMRLTFFSHTHVCDDEGAAWWIDCGWLLVPRKQN